MTPAQPIPEGSNYRWDYCNPANAGYLRLSNNDIRRTIPLVESVLNLDLDEAGNVVGVELLHRTTPHEHREDYPAKNDGV